jgi:hypothetical protein
MAKATRVHSTPPLNTPIDTTRRRFLAVAAGASVAVVGTLTAAVAIPAPPVDASPALCAAVRHLDRAHANLKIAQASNEEAEAIWNDWQVQNPQPASKRGTRRWIKRGSAYHARLTAPSWQALLVAETAFTERQTAVAAVPIAGKADLRIMIAAAELYDVLYLARINRSPIARAVIAHFAREGVLS